MNHFACHTTNISKPGSRGLGWDGVLSRVLLVATLVCTLALARPVEAREFYCNAPSYPQCLDSAITTANKNGEENIIYLGKGDYVLKNSLPWVEKNSNWLTIQGKGAGNTFIHGSCWGLMRNSTTGECSASNNFSVLSVAPTGALQLIGVTIADGESGSGGGIFNQGLLRVYGSTIKKNLAHLYGGGICNLGDMYLQDSTVLNNFVHNGRGGGIFNMDKKAEIAFSTISGNKTTNGYGSGIANGYLGKGTESGGMLILRNSTISGNTSKGPMPGVYQPDAGGILNDGTGEAWLKSVTITANIVPRPPSLSAANSPYAGGVFNRGRFYIANTIVAGNVAGGEPSDCRGQMITEGGNLVGSVTGCEMPPLDPWNPNWPTRAPDFVGTKSNPKDPLLAPLDDNGGGTCTHALRPGSTAINNAWTGRPDQHPFACEKYDQRWIMRDSNVSGKDCDIGAFELRYGVGPSGLSCTE